ncbi:hypothetical protein [Streptomyces sp. NPDC005385]|uniref:hypothetical protein n=1 Tax=Streptomyces sp. NPDC005385 TaxID=3157039 RepID=UPI0033A0C46A
MIRLLDLLGGIPAPWLSLIGVIFGGAGLKFLEWFLGRGQVKEDVATQLRDELRKELKELRERVDELEAENDKWRARAFKAEEEVAVRNALIASHGCMGSALKPETD